MGSRDFAFAMPRTFICAHGTNRFLGPCMPCISEAEAERVRERARVQEPAWVIEEAIRKRRRWFDGCAFCPPSVDLVVHTVHQDDCPFRVALGEARIAYGLHLVDVSEGRASDSPSEVKDG